MSCTVGRSKLSHKLASEVQPSSYIDNNNIYEVKQITLNKEIPDLNTEPVIFEPIGNIKLSRDTYKVTSYINYDPYLANFKKFDRYLSSCKKDLRNENKMGTLMEIDPRYKLQGHEWDCSQKLPSRFGTIKSRFYRQYLRILKEADVITDLFKAVHQRF